MTNVLYSCFKTRFLTGIHKGAVHAKYNFNIAFLKKEKLLPINPAINSRHNKTLQLDLNSDLALSRKQYAANVILLLQFIRNHYGLKCYQDRTEGKNVKISYSFTENNPTDRALETGEWN